MAHRKNSKHGYSSLSEYPRDGGLKAEDVARLEELTRIGVAEVEAKRLADEEQNSTIAADEAKAIAVSGLVEQMTGPAWEGVPLSNKEHIAREIITPPAKLPHDMLPWFL